MQGGVGFGVNVRGLKDMCGEVGGVSMGVEDGSVWIRVSGVKGDEGGVEMDMGDGEWNDGTCGVVRRET